jgi:hypothetical protein
MFGVFYTPKNPSLGFGMMLGTGIVVSTSLAFAYKHFFLDPEAATIRKYYEDHPVPTQIMWDYHDPPKDPSRPRSI